MLVFGGSGGGLTTSFAAALLAAHGYPSLALAYFKAPGLPQTLRNIPLEYFTRALGVLRAQPGVDPRHVLVAGESRGGEAALLLGAYFPRLVNGVIAGVPSSVVNPGWPDTSQPAWTLGGRPLPAVSPSEFGQPNPPGKPQAVIPVERIRGPILLTCGEQDLSLAVLCATSTPSPHACAPTGSPIRSPRCAIATPATSSAASPPGTSAA